MARARSARNSSKSFYSRNKREEEEEEKIEQPEEPESEPAAEPPQPIEEPVQEEAEPAQTAPAPVQSYPTGGAHGLPKLNKQQHFEIGQNISDRETSKKLVAAGELDRLPENLQPRKEELEAQNAAGRLGHTAAKQWSSTGNTISVDPTSIKDVKQLAYFGTTLTDDDQREALYKTWAKQEDMSLDDLYYQAETMLGDKAFDQPKSNKGKLKQAGMYAIDGTALDVDTMTAAQAVQAMHMMPDKHPYRKSAELAVRKLYGLPKDFDLSFVESGDLLNKDYNSAVTEFRNAFSISDGEVESNVRAYLDMVDGINAEYESPRVRQQMLDTLSYVYGDITGVNPPPLDELEAMIAQYDADDAAAAEQAISEEPGPFARLLSKAGDVVTDMFKAGAKFFGIGDEEEEAEEEPAVPDLSSNASSGGSGEVQGPVYQPENAEDAAEVAAMQGAVETGEVQGPEYQPQSTPETEEPQATVSNAEKYANRIAYDPNMTDAQVFAQWRKGATLDERNMAQIKWVTDNRNVQALFNGMGMYGDLGTSETGKRNVIDKFNYFGNSIGAASMVISNGTLPKDAADTAMLALGDVVNEIDRIVSDPNSGITVPKGQNMYEYVLNLPEYSDLAAQVEAVSNAQVQANEAYAEQAISEEKARQAQLESDRKAMLAGNGTPEMAARLAAEYGSEYVDLSDDEMRAVYRFQLSERSSFFSDSGTFWNGSTAAAAEGNNLRRAGRGYGEFKASLKNETQALIDEYTTAAIKMGMSLEDYLGNAGITDLSQVIDIAYSGMLERGNAYANDAEAQEAAAAIATSSVGKWDAAVMGAQHGAESYAADFSQTLYMVIDAADYSTAVLDLQNDYRGKYGDEMAASMYYADLMAYIDSGALSEESAKDLLDHMARADSIFDVAFEIDPGFLEGLARTTHEELQKDVEALEAVAQTLPENERWIFNGVSGIAYSIPGMAVSTVTGGVSGSALLGSAVGWGMTEYSSAYDANRAKGMSPGMAGFMALGNAGVSAAVNMGGTGTQMDLIFGGSAYQTFRNAIMGKDGKGLIKAIGKEILSKGHEEGVEEVTETVLGGMYDLLDNEALAIDSGAAPSLSRTVRGIVETIEEADAAAIGKELLTSYGMGVAYGGIFSLAGVAKTAVAAKRGVNAQNRYASINLAAQMADGTVPFTEENVGKVYAAVQKDLEDPRYRRWIDSANMAAKDQNATVTAMMMGAGGEQRKTAVAEAQKAQEYEAKAEAARSASQTAQGRWWELRERLAGGDLSVEVELESARMQWQKAETSLQEAENAAQKSKERAAQSMSEWLKACRAMGTTAKSWEIKRRADQIANARMEAALRLSDIYNNQAQNEAEAEREVAYAEDYVFQEEDVDESGIEQVAIDTMSDEELDAEIAAIAQAEADEQVRIAEIENQREALGLTDEAAQEMTGEVSAATNARKERIIAREKGRFNDAFERMQQAIEMENDEAADQIQTEYDTIGDRLRTLGVDTDALIAEQYGISMADADTAYAAAQEQEAQKAEDEKYGRLTDDLSRRMEATNASLENVATARRYFADHEIYVNESQVVDILAADGVKSIPQFNRKHHTRLVTKRESGAMPLDGHVMSDIAGEAAGSVQTDADPVAELLRVVQAGKKYVAEQKAQKAEAKELAEKRKAAEQRRRASVAALTGKETDSERQAKQIDALVADENSTVEQIDNAVDRIEGVSMSMNDGGTAIEPEQTTLFDEETGTVNSMFKDPVMQKLASDLYKSWGIRLRTAELDPRDEGFYDRESNTVVLNKRLTSGEKQRTVVMHELIHFCEGQPWYPQFKKDILAGAYASEAEIEENRKRLRDMGYAEGDIDFELVAHAAKPLFEGDEVLIGNLLEKGKASAVKRAYAAIAQYIARRKAKKMGMGKQYDALLSARKTLAKGLKNSKPVTGKQSTVMHSYSGPVLSQYENKTAQEVDWINQAVKDQLKGTTHEVQTDRAAIVETLSRIEELGGVQKALRDLMSRPVDRWNAQDQAMAQVLMAKAEYDGDVTTEAVVAMMHGKAGSEAGLALQKRKLLARMDSQNALALAAKLASDFNLKNGGSSQYAPVGNSRPLEKSGVAGDEANAIIDRAQSVNNAIIAERGMDDIVERENRWGVPVTGAQMYLIEKYGLEHTDLTGVHYSRATTKQRMLAAILATDTDVVYDTDAEGNRNGLLGLIQQLEAMKAGKAVQTVADLTYISNQMAEMKAQSNGSEDPYLNTQEAKTALARAYDAINNVVPVTMGQRSGAVAYMNMLSATTTGVKNVLGNVVMGPMEAVSETIATIADKVVSGKTKNRTTAVSTLKEITAGLQEGLSEIAHTFADTYIYQADTSYSRKYETSGDAPRVFQNSLAESKRRMVDFIMQLGDRPFFKAEYSRQFEMIKRLCEEGKMKKKDVVTTADGRQIVVYVEMTEADMYKEAAQRALERVFQEDNVIVDWVNRAPAVIRPFLQAVVPFVKTPTNIAKRMLDYSPIGLAKTIAVNGYHAAHKDGGFDQRKFVMGIGRGLTGTGMIMAGALLSALGVLDIEDGYGEEDDSKLYGAGMANYDPYGKYINIDGNKTSLDWLGAAGIWMTIGAAAAKEWDEETGFGEAMYSTMLKSGPEILNLLFDNTMLSSMSDLLGGAEDGEELGANVVKTIAGSALQQYFSPANIRQFAKFTDEYERDYRHDNPIIEAINKNVIRYWPVLRQTLPIKHDITGDAVRQSSKYGWGREDENAVLNFLNMYMSPTNIQSDKGDEALDEVIDLSYRLGNTSCIPSNLITTNGKITIPKTLAKKTTLDTDTGENNLILSVDEQRKYNQMYASLCFNGSEKGRRYEKLGIGSYGNVQGIRDLIDSRSYQRASDEERAKMIGDIMTEAKEIVRAQICIDRGYER